MTASSSQGDAPGRGMRIAFAGVSHWHFSVDAQYLALAQASGVEIVGLSDDDGALAKQRGDELGCGWTTDVDDLVTRFKPDLVIALPRIDRAPEQVGRLLERKVPLFAEKPLGLCAADVWPLVERAEQGWVTVAFPQRYQPMWVAYDRLRESGALGEIGNIGVRMVNGPPWRYRSYNVPWMLDPAIAGGGPLRNIGIHGTDMLTKLVGDRGLSVVAAVKTDRVHGEAIEDFVSALMRTDDGIVVSLATGYTFSPPKPGDMDIHLGAKGAYLIQRRDTLTVYPAEGQPEVVENPPGFNMYRTIFFDALRRLRAGDPPIATVRDCARANELVDAIYAAAG